MKKKIAFATCVQLGLSCIEAILSRHKIDLLITLSDDTAQNKSGRIRLDKIANQHKISLLKIKHINDDNVRDELLARGIDWFFIIGWSQIAGKKVIDSVNDGCIGMHPTLLPIGRGRAPIPWTIIKGLSESGVTMFKLDTGVDSGPIIGQKRFPVSANANATDLYKIANKCHVDLILSYIDDIVFGNVRYSEQNNEQATYWPGRKPDDGEILETMSVLEAERLVRALTDPFPGAYFVDLKNNTRINIKSASVSAKRGKIKLIDGYLNPIKYSLESL